MSKLSFRARALDASKPMPIFLAEDLPDLPDYSAINRAVPQMPSGMEKEEECEHHLQRAICTGLIIPTPEVCQVEDLEFYESCYPDDYKMPKQHIHMQPLWQEQETPEYDIDSEDDRWLKQQRHPELTELKFEQMMDKLERSSGQTVVTLNEAKLLLERSDDLVIAVYDYWLNKRLKTQHPLILSVRTESRPGQAANNPYLAFRRRTEKMQTRKNRKNDESSYEKMLKLRRDLARALSLLELVARREKAKKELVKLTASLAEKRYHAGDFAGSMLADIPQSRPTYSAASLALAAASFRRDAFAPHFPPHPAPHPAPPRPSPVPTDLPRQREKRPYKRRKHKHHTAGNVRDSGVYTSSEEESGGRTEPGSPPDDGPYAFRRKAGCFYEMPTSTLLGDPVDPTDRSKDALYKHEIDERYRFTLTTIKQPYTRCVGFARRRVGRGGRVLLDRVRAPGHQLWTHLPFQFPASTEYKAQRNEEVILETEQHRNPRTLTRDYHESGRWPWRHAFRKHLAANLHLWTDSENSVNSAKPSEYHHYKCEPSGASDEMVPLDVPSGSCDVKRKRRWSDCSDSSYNSDDSLEPVEQVFEKLFDEVNTKWLHFRPKTPPLSPKPLLPPDDQLPVTHDTPISVELTIPSEAPSTGLDTFTTSEFKLSDLYDNLTLEQDTSLDISNDDLLHENLGLTEAQVESILSETDLKELEVIDDKKISEDILEELVKDVDIKDPFLLQGQSGSSGMKLRKRSERASFGSTVVNVTPLEADEPIFVDKLVPESPKPVPVPKPVKIEPLKVKEEVRKAPMVKETVVHVKKEVLAPAPVPNSKIIVEEVNEVPHIKVESKRPVQQSTPTPSLRKPKEEPSEPAPGRAAPRVTTVAASSSSPLKKHVITAGGARRDAITLPQIVTVAVSDSLKVRLQNHLLSSQAAGGELQNGPLFTHAAAHPARDIGSVVSVASTSSPRRVSTPVVLAPALHQKQIQLTQPPVVVAQSHLQHVASNKLKVLHATSLTQTQRTQLLAQSRAAGITQLPTVVSLATLGDAKANPTQLQLKTAPGVTQFFEIKGGQLGKGPHLVNVVRQPQPGKTTVARLDLNDGKKRQVVSFDGTLKGNIATTTRPHRVSVSLDGRQIVRAALPNVRAPVRHQIQFKNRTLVATPQMRTSEPSTSITIAAPTKTASIPSSVVANLLQKNVQLPSGQKIAISSGGQALAANVQAIAFTTQQLKARQRLIAQPRVKPQTELVEAHTAPVTASSSSAALSGETPMEAEQEASTNGGVRRRGGDNLPMEVT